MDQAQVSHSDGTGAVDECEVWLDTLAGPVQAARLLVVVSGRGEWHSPPRATPLGPPQCHAPFPNFSIVPCLVLTVAS